ncbi:MAG: RMD1 family protein [Nostoc sp. DedQUE08]|uniref:RMD1 family protein n=1 Tax=unclassified Nostoc TaxID=2593658 RepID=UPI002AD58336|nr:MULTISPECIES: RMD1 family protein [unclassified Nostoc]MDZ8033060.1 RMD1 family protein [Nostoc sp. DedSLP04]MDZ8067910.1 RMD1 family protein [Nostoc sp. DedQUE08]MDZ8092717.1 RMD1 family protein [Nostoc sp. DedQUE05]
MQKLLFNDKDRFRAQALFLGKGINLQTLDNYVSLASMPLMIRAGEEGYAVLLAYGAVVLFNLEPGEKVAFLTKLSSQISGPFADPETEEVEVHLSISESERAKEGKILLHELSIERLQIVADILAKSVVLSHYETSLATVFDQIEPFAASLQRENRSRQQSRELLRQLGTTLLVQHKIVGQVEIIDKPELLWESPQLENLYLRLEDEYEIRERHHALERKLELIAQTAQTVLEFMQHSSSQRVEWYVVILIVVEILLSLYDILFKN